MDSVEIYNDKLMAGTWIISEGFNRVHSEVLKTCRKYESEMIELQTGNGVSNTFTRRKQKREKGGTGGKPITEYMLNEGQTIFLGSLFRAKSGDDPVLRFKVQLAKDFVKMKAVISALQNQAQTPEWIENRAMGKAVRRDETDTIRDFVLYAKAQGSENADQYYKVLSRCVNSNMFDFNGNFKNKRDVMTATQLLDVKFADKIVSRGLIEGMSCSLPYKDIYQLVSTRIADLAKMYGKSEVISKQLAIE